MSTSNQQTLVDLGANERPPMLERGNYIPWESRFKRFLDNKLEEGECMWNSIQNILYVRPMIPDPDGAVNLNGTVKQDACKNPKEMWEQIKRLIFGSDVTSHVRHSRLMDEFDKFAAKEGESLESVYERLTTLVNIMDRNNVHPILVSINTKILNCLQHEWSKYVTMVHHNQTGETVSYDMLYDSLVQFEPHALASKAKKFSTPTNNRLRTSSNTRNQAVIQDGRVDIQTKNACYSGNSNKNARKQSRNQAFNAGNGNDDSNQIIQRKPRVHDAQYFREQVLLAMKDKAERNLINEEYDFMLDTSYGEETMEELTAAVMSMARIQRADGNAETVPSYDAKAISENDKNTIDRLLNEKNNIQSDFFKIKNEKIIIQHETRLAKKAFKERQNRYLEDICDLEEKLSSHDRIFYKMGQSIQTIHMLGKTPNKVYDSFLKAGLGYKNPKRLKKAIAAEPKMYDGEKLNSTKLVIDSPDSKETLEDAEESRLKMRNKMVQINYAKLNALYETFVPQQDFSVEQTYFSILSTSSNGSATKEVSSDLPIPKMPKESKLLKMFDTLGVAINGLRTRIDNTLLEDRQRRWLSDCQNSLRVFYKTDVILMSVSLSKSLEELKEEFIKEVQEVLNIFESMERKVHGKSSKENILQNEIDRLLEVSLTSEIQNCVLISVKNRKMSCQKLNLRKVQVTPKISKPIFSRESKFFKMILSDRKLKDLLMTISKLKNKLKTVDKGKNVNTKFDKSETSGTLLCITPLPKHIATKAKKVSNSKVNLDRSKQVTSHPQSKNEQGVESSNSVRRPTSKDTKSKNRVLKNTNDKSSTTHCVAHYALSGNASVKRALFTTPIAEKSKTLRATSVVAKSRLSIAKTPTATNKEDTAYPCLHSTKTTKGMKINTPYPDDSIRRNQDMESI
ncbi:hypothetical protein Tco_0578896 [Tanacetum coccineum]